MSLVIARELSVSYGPKVLFDGADLTIGPRDRIGLVGANGTGKSTLLKILAGVSKPDSGTVQYQRRARAGYLPQELVELPGGPLLEAVLSSVPGRDELQRELEAVQGALAASTDQAEQLELAEQLAELSDEAEHFEERHGRYKAERILSGLGFTDFTRPTATLSGGWQMRAALAGLLLQDPDLLLLDEPTNHLDVPTLAWFDQFLRSSKKALVLISHDRDFLNRQIGRVVSLEVEGPRSYVGNYDAYKRQRAEELEQLRARAEKVANRRAELEAFIERFGAKASKARQAQSRAKMLERLETVELPRDRDKVHFQFPPVPRSGREVVTLTGIHKAYGNNVIYRGLDARVERGQRIGVVGVNGAGKTTLLKLIAGETSPDAGEVKLGHNVTLGYYAQHHAEALDRTQTIFGEVAPLVPDKPQSYVRGVLGAFLFSGDDVEKKIGVLSGGERARVSLARLLLAPANLMLMDEPTNHLDLDSSEMLIEALKGYEGTLLFVSHNRSFVNQLATDIWEVRDGKVNPFPGNLDDYLYHQQKLAEPVAAATDERKVSSEKERRRLEAEERQRRSAQTGPIKKEIARLEARIAELEKVVKESEAALADPGLYQDFARAKPLLDGHRDAKAELEGLYESWEEQQGRLAAALGSGDSGR